MGGKGSGRKSTGVEMAQFSIYMPDTLRSQVDKLRRDQNKSRSQLICDLLGLALRDKPVPCSQTTSGNLQTLEQELSKPSASSR